MRKENLKLVFFTKHHIIKYLKWKHPIISHKHHFFKKKILNKNKKNRYKASLICFLYFNKTKKLETRQLKLRDQNEYHTEWLTKENL